MHANEPEMAKKWEKKKKSESLNFLKKGIKAFVSEKMGPEQYHRYMQYVFDTQFNTSDEKKMKKSIIKKINVAQKKKGLPLFKEEDLVDEGFGGELKGKDKEKFEKARKENAEVLGYKLTGKSDIKEAINHPKVQKQAKELAKVLKDVVAAAKKDDRKLARKLVGNIYDIYNDLDWTIQRDLRYKESVKEALHPYKDFEQQDREKEYDLNLGSFIKRYQMMLKFMKKYKEVPDKNKRPWAAAIRKKLGQSRFNGMIGDFELMQMYLKDFDKFRNIKDKYAFDIKGESVNEDNIKFSKEEMAQLHKDGKIEKDGHTYVYKEDIVNEAASWGYVKTFLIGIIRKKQAKKMDGYLVDMQTANVILKVGNALNKSNQEKFGKLPIKKMAQIAWKMVK